MRCSEVVAGVAGRAARAHRCRARPAPPVARTARTRRATPYLQIAAAPGRLDVRWDIALRDLDVALDLDSRRRRQAHLGRGARRLAAHRGLRAAAAARSRAARCAPVGRGLERRNDGAYAVLHLRSTCTLRGDAGESRTASSPTSIRPIAASPRVQRAGQDGRAVGARAERAMAAAARRRRRRVGAASGARRSPPRRCVVGCATTSAQRALRVLLEGIRHILTGYDHVLFLLCLLLPSVMRQDADRLAAGRAARRRRVWPVVGIVSAFTVAHSITPRPGGVEAGLADAGVHRAGDRGDDRPGRARQRPADLSGAARRRHFFFGLIHGFGFAGVLAELQPADAPTSPGRCSSSTSGWRSASW